MLQTSKGYFLLELLLSLSALLMLCTFLVPLLVQIRDQSRQLKIENHARQYMFEELQARMMEQQNFNNYSVIQDGVIYQIVWHDTYETGREVVCVKVERNSFVHEIEKCRIFE